MKKSIIFFLFFFTITTLLKSQACAEECSNLIQNPNLDLTYTGSETIYLHEAYEILNNNYVQPWKASAGSAHQAYFNELVDECWNGWWIPADAEPTFHGQVAFYDPSNQKCFMEGIMQDINFIKDDFTSYCLEFDASKVENCFEISNEANPSLVLRAGNDIVSDYSSGVNYGLPFSPLGNDVEIIETVLIDNTSMETFSIEYSPDNPYSQLEFLLIIEENQIDPSITEEIETHITLENLSLKCKTTAIGAINSTSSDRMFHFEVQNNSNTVISSYSWDFGDDHMSSDIDPVHVYEDYGPYFVCLDYVDINGCCGSKCQDIFISPPPSACTDNEVETLYIDATNTMTERFSQLVDMEMFESGGTLVLKDIVINGQFTLDESFNFNNCNFYFRPGAGLIVKSPGKIDILSSTFQGCTQMWKGIIVEEGTNENLFWFRGNIIKDAYTALEITDKTNILQNSNIFIDNYIGIYSAPSTTLKTSLWSPILNSTFTSEGNMLQAYDEQPAWSQVPYAGILVNDLDHLVVMELTIQFTFFKLVNTFKNIKNGIIAKNTNLISSQNIFQDLVGETTLNTEPVNLSGSCIYAENIISLSANENKFYDSNAGVIVEKSPNSVINISDNELKLINSVNEFRYGIYLMKNNASKITVTNNNMELGVGTYWAIFAGYASNLVDLNINHNVISHNTEQINGISLKDLSFPNNIFGKVNHNTIYCNSSVGGESAISARECENITFNENEIYRGEAFTGGYGYSAMISCSYSPHCHFRDNIIDFDTNNDGLAIWQSGSLDNLYCCNTINQGKIGFYYTQANDMLDMSTNEMNNCRTGLYLRNQITPQANKGNLWTGEASRARIQAPSGSTAEEIAESSIFRVNSSDVTETKPMNFSPIGIGDDWFGESNFSTPDCETSPECGISPYEISIGSTGTNGTTTNDPCERFSKYIEALISPKIQSLFQYQNEWVMYYYIMQHFDDLPIEEWEDCDQIKNFMNSNDKIASYVRVNKAFEEIYTPTSSQSYVLKTQQENISNALDAIQGLYNNAPEDYMEYDPDLAPYQTSITNSTQSILGIKSSLEAQSSQILIQVLGDIQMLETDYDFEERLIKVWTVKVKVALYGNSSISNGEWQDIENIANGCPEADGLALVEARNLLISVAAQPRQFIDSNVCDRLENRNARAYGIKVQSINIYPNPTSGLVNINLTERVVKEVIVNVYKLDGLLARSKRISNGKKSVVLDMEGLRNGIYILEVLEGNKKIESQKIVLIK